MASSNRQIRKGRYVGPFFIDSALAGLDGNPPLGFEHRIHVENTTTLPCRGILTSEAGNDDTQYVDKSQRSKTWTATFCCIGRAPLQMRHKVEMAAAEKKPVVRTISLQSKRDAWPTWESSNITPVIELAWR